MYYYYDNRLIINDIARKCFSCHLKWYMYFIDKTESWFFNRICEFGLDYKFPRSYLLCEHYGKAWFNLQSTILSDFWFNDKLHVPCRWNCFIMYNSNIEFQTIYPTYTVYEKASINLCTLWLSQMVHECKDNVIMLIMCKR